MVGAAIQTSKNLASEVMAPKAFLEWERRQRVRHEFIDGKIYTISGASRKHNKITFNLNGLLWFIQQSLDTHFYKIETGEWVVGDILRNPTDKVKLRALPIELKLSDIYKGVDFKTKR